MNKQQSFGSLMDTSGISKLVKNQGEDTKLDDSFIDQIKKLWDYELYIWKLNAKDNYHYNWLNL